MFKAPWPLFNTWQQVWAEENIYLIKFKVKTITFWQILLEISVHYLINKEKTT